MSQMKTRENYNRKIIIGLLAVLSLVAAFFFANDKISSKKELVKAPVIESVQKKPEPETSYPKQVDTSVPEVEQVEIEQQISEVPAPVEKPAPVKKADLPTKKIIDASFLVQAPNANWDALHEDACEEASLIMVKHFLTGSKIGSVDEGEREIQELVAYESANGYEPSITLEQLVKIAQDYYRLPNPHIKYEVSTEKLKQEIAEGKPIIIPAAGKILPNPNFRNGGPLYHMLVIVGYDNDEFITNDPGTRKGRGFRYKYDDIIRSIHDWNGGDVINGQKAYLVFGS